MKAAGIAVLLALVALSVIACFVVQRNGWTLYYGDAEAHLEVARRIVDSRSPGYAQLGGTWLPLPHLLMLPLVANDRLWRTGLAGTIPSAICFVAGGMFLFATARRAFKSTAAGVAAAGVFALNPNILYLQATPMTEPIFFGSVMALLYFTVLFEDTASPHAVVGAGVASIAATLTRYEGWFLLPFVAAYFLIRAPRRKLRTAFLYCVIACLGPLAWLAHNAWWFADPLDFYRGPYSAMAIQKKFGTYPGEHDWSKAFHYVLSAGRQTAGWAAVACGITGILATVEKRVFWPVFLLLLSPVFYIWSIHSSGTPIFVPNLPPHGYYNTRYGLCFLPLFAFTSGGLVCLFANRARTMATAALLVIAAAFWLVNPSIERCITWKESERNSEARRAWTQGTARFLVMNYQGGGIFASLGDVAGIFREAGIPLREVLQDGNEPQWMNAVAEPDYFLRERWAVAQAGDSVSLAMTRTGVRGARYVRVETIQVKDAPAIEIYRRDSDEHTIH